MANYGGGGDGGGNVLIVNFFYYRAKYIFFHLFIHTLSFSLLKRWSEGEEEGM